MIVGDTWGIVQTELYKLSTVYQRTHYNHNYDLSVLNSLDYILMSRGHSVYNRSWGGSHNYQQLTFVDTCITAGKSHGFNIDLVIWFHTELLKNSDRDRIKQIGLENYLDETAEIIYTYASEIKQSSPSTKWAIIGATGALRENNLLDWAEFKINNLRSYVFNKNTPNCHSYYVYHHMNRWDDIKDFISIEEMETEKQKCNIIDELQQDKTLFFNTIHPGPNFYTQLNNDLIRHFNL